MTKATALFTVVLGSLVFGAALTHAGAGQAAPRALTAAQAADCVDTIRSGLQDYLCGQGGQVSVQAGRMLLSTERGRHLVLIASLDAKGTHLAFRGVPIASASMRVRNLVMDYDKLRAGEFEVVGRPTVEPAISLDRSVIEDMLKEHDIRSLQLSFTGEEVMVAGRVPYSFFTVPFRMRGKLAIENNNVAFRLTSLAIKGHPADEHRVLEVQSKLRSLVPMEEALAELHAGAVDLRAGQVQILSGPAVVYACRLGASPAIGD